MLEVKYFLNIVRKSFSFLEELYDFKYIGFEDKSRKITINYKKNELITSIEYSRVNDCIEVNIFNHVSIVKPGEYNWKYSLDLSSLIKKNEGVDFDFNSLKNSSLDEKIEINSFYLKTYGEAILSEKEWFSWGDIFDYKQYVPPHLP